MKSSNLDQKSNLSLSEAKALIRMKLSEIGKSESISDSEIDSCFKDLEEPISKVEIRSFITRLVDQAQ